MNPRLDLLQPYPFERMNELKAGLQVRSNASHIPLSLGEPKHQPPDFVVQALAEKESLVRGLTTYPPTKGVPELRAAIADWLTQRFGLPADAVDPEQHVLPVNGTREALFAFAQAVLDGDQNRAGHRPVVLLPNPFYQIYEGAALLAGLEPYYVPCTAASGFLPDFDAVPTSVWERTALAFICSPGNPTGAVMDLPVLVDIIQRAERYDFIVAADECYSEIYPLAAPPPPGLLQAAVVAGNPEFRRCVVFHSLSKRSNLPGLRSGFAAGDAELMASFLLYRTYHGSAMPVHVAQVSALAWRDEKHVDDNRAIYEAKFAQVTPIISAVMPVARPPASFYLWPRTPIDDQEFTAGLFAQEHVTVLPGSFLSRVGTDGHNPGTNHVRMALVAPLDECLDAAERVARYVSSLT